MHFKIHVFLSSRKRMYSLFYLFTTLFNAIRHQPHNYFVTINSIFVWKRKQYNYDDDGKDDSAVINSLVRKDATSAQSITIFLNKLKSNIDHINNNIISTTILLYCHYY